MIPAKIDDVFIQLTTDFSGVIKNIVAGKFIENQFTLQDSIFRICPFLEGTLEALPYKESFPLDGMLIISDSNEFNVDLELFKGDDFIDVLIHNRTNVYKIVDQLNQNRNDIFFIKREIAEKNKELERLRKVADKANEEKTRFLAMMSHEIRNPLNSILGYAEMIASEKLNENVSKYIKYLSLAGKNLKVIVEDILDLSRIEAGKLELISETISIKEIINSCENDFKHQETNEDVKLVFLVSEDLPEKILGDQVRLQQILSNLISNAIKFTDKGSIHINVKLISKTENKAKLLFEVADTGRGMSKEQTTKIFEEYQQNQLDDNRLKGGAGLGLAIVNRLVNAMKGEVSVESTLNKGSTFSVKIPFDIVKKENKQVKNDLEQVDLEGKEILIADDDILNQTIVSHILNAANAEVTLVNDGLEALSKIKAATFDVILLDINMPNMTGEELIQEKKSFEHFNSKTPVLALTANTSQEDIKRYINLGFTDVISKPYTKTEFLEKINKII